MSVAISAQVADMIEKHKFAIICVGSDEQDWAFCYTVGLTGQGSVPELLMFCKLRDLQAHFNIMNFVARRLLDTGNVRAGVVEQAVEIRDKSGGEKPVWAPVLCLELADEMRNECMRVDNVHYGRDGFKALVVVLPDEDGAVPDELAARERLAEILGTFPEIPASTKTA